VILGPLGVLELACVGWKGEERGSSSMWRVMKAVWVVVGQHGGEQQHMGLAAAAAPEATAVLHTYSAVPIPAWQAF
jgi:hypothetical protein